MLKSGNILIYGFIIHNKLLISYLQPFMLKNIIKYKGLRIAYFGFLNSLL